MFFLISVLKMSTDSNCSGKKWYFIDDVYIDCSFIIDFFYRLIKSRCFYLSLRAYYTFLPPPQMVTELKHPRTRSSKQTFEECDSTSPPAIDYRLPVEGRCYCAYLFFCALPFINNIIIFVM